MAIRVKCKCGKSLKISSKHADKKLACPGCQKPFRIPAAKFAAIAAKKLAAASKSTASRASAAPAASASSSASGSGGPLPANLDDDLSSLGSGLIGLSQSDMLYDLAGDEAKAVSEAAPAAVIVESDSTVDVGYAADRKAAAARRRLADPVAGPKKSFWADALLSFIYPVGTSTSIIHLVIIFVIELMEYFANQFLGGGLGLFISFIFKGWFASLYMSVIRDTAAGLEDMPGFDLEGGWLDGIIWPALKFFGAVAIVLFPAVILTILAAMGVTPSGMNKLLPIWLLAGIFLVPMSLLLFALESPGTIVRIDLVLTTIAKSILPYLSIWIMLAIVMMALAVTSVGGAVVLTLFFPKGALTTSVGEFIASSFGGIALSLISIYLMLVAMRIIGLYYLHFKKRFAFELE